MVSRQEGPGRVSEAQPPLETRERGSCKSTRLMQVHWVLRKRGEDEPTAQGLSERKALATSTGSSRECRAWGVVVERAGNGVRIGTSGRRNTDRGVPRKLSRGGAAGNGPRQAGVLPGFVVPVF